MEVGVKDIYLIDGARTPFGIFGGSLRNIIANDLGAVAARGAIERSYIRPDNIDYVVFGNALQTSSDAMYGARHVALKSGVPFDTPALTINNVGGSGLQALIYGAQLIKSGDAQCCLVGGMENMSSTPYIIRGARWSGSVGRTKVEDSLWSALTDSYTGLLAVETAEKLAKKYKISRIDQDEFAYRSFTLALAAERSGLFREEIIPVTVSAENKLNRKIESDEGVKEVHLSDLEKLEPVVGENDSVTLGNSSGPGDGAAALTLMSSILADKLNIKPMAKVVSYQVSGVDPDLMGIGSVPALSGALKKADLKIEDIGLFEINEAYAVQHIVCERELGIDRKISNVNGGAIALGHPIAASGARILLTLALEMSRRGTKYGAAAVSTGGGQGLAVVIESMKDIE